MSLCKTPSFRRHIETNSWIRTLSYLKTCGLDTPSRYSTTEFGWNESFYGMDVYSQMR